MNKYKNICGTVVIKFCKLVTEFRKKEPLNIRSSCIYKNFII